MSAVGVQKTDECLAAIAQGQRGFAAPTALAISGVQLGYLMAGSILVETVFSWPGTGLLLSSAILQRDIPLLQGTVLVLALIFVGLNLLVDIVQPFLDPRIRR